MVLPNTALKPAGDKPDDPLRSRSSTTTRSDAARQKELDGATDPAVWGRVRSRLLESLERVETHAHELLERGRRVGSSGREAERAARALAVDLGRLDLPVLAGLARHLESLLARPEVGADDAVHVAGTVEDIRGLLDSAVAELRASASTRGTIVVAGPPTPDLDRACWILGARGHRVVSFTDRPHDDVGDAVAVIVAVGDRHSPGVTTTIKAAAESWSAPIVGLYADDCTGQELRDLAVHCKSLLRGDTTSEAIFFEIDRLELLAELTPVCFAYGRVPARSLKELRQRGFTVRRATSLDELPDLIRREHALVVIGRGVPTADAIGVARLFRAIPSIRTTPLLWLTDEDADDTAELAAALAVTMVPSVTSATAARARAVLATGAAARHVNRETPAAITSWTAARVLVDRLLVATQRAAGRVALARVQLGGELEPARLGEVHDLIGREFRRGDIVGLEDPQTVVLALPGVSRRVAVRRLEGLIQRLGLEDMATAAVTHFPSDGRSADELLAAARTVRALADEHGGPAVVSSRWRPDVDGGADVLVVEADPLVGQMIAAALAGTSRTVEILDNGRSALDRLTSTGQGALPAVLLLDLDAPGLGGLRLLKELDRADVLSQVQVLMMTARSSEADLRTAIATGVADVIRKPFSATLLLHRVERMLEDR